MRATGKDTLQLWVSEQSEGGREFLGHWRCPDETVGTSGLSDSALCP